jgi:outer membrane lipoprotein-sorting protein
MGRSTRRRTEVSARAVMAGAALLLALAPAPGCAQDARAIVDSVDRLWRGTSSRADMTMEIVTAHWRRSLEIKIWSLGADYALARVVQPAKEAGTATLKVKDAVWNYLPRVDRTIKIPPSLMMGSWMGSHFTNDDLVKESRLIQDYDIQVAFDGTRDGVAVWEFALTPKPNAAVVWSRIVMQVRRADLLPAWMRYYDEDGSLVRTMTFSDDRRFGARVVPATLTVQPADKPDEHTTIHYADLQFDIGLAPDFFSLRSLRGRE